MNGADLTRLLDGRRQGYVGARLQQGRSLLDTDTNEGRRARATDFRAAVRDVSGARGSVDDGFLPDLVPGQVVRARLTRFGAQAEAFVLDYPLRPGSFHLSGWRLEQPRPESVVFQREFLQIGPTAAPLAQIGTQRQLSILRAWEQPVTATEDAELLEAAMHGADGATRLRRMRRVETRTVEADDCTAAFAEVLDALGDGDVASYDPVTGAFASNARLQLSFGTEPPGDCPGCDAMLRGRYLGGEDQAIRLMLASSASYVWAHDNAAPLYRARLVLDGGGARVEMLTPPKDSHHQPELNRVVELLPWSTLLDNGTPAGGKKSSVALANEKQAERVGVLAIVDTPYDAAERSFHARFETAGLEALGVTGASGGVDKGGTAAEASLKSGVPPASEVVALEWDPAHPHASELNPGAADDGAEVGYVYLRFWHVKRPDEPMAIPLNAGRPLGRTGVVPVFSGKGRRGDFWCAALRVDDRERIVPWALMEPGGRPPDGPHEVLAPLALVEWRSFVGRRHRVISIRDCRPALPAITRRGCCTHVVGRSSDARFASVQTAIDALPARGGRICIREGVFAGAVRLAGRHDVVIEGCGARTVLVADEGAADANGAAETPLIALTQRSDGGRVLLRNLDVEARGQVALDLRGQGITLDGLGIRSGSGGDDDATPAQNAIRALGVTRCRIVGCTLVMAAGASGHAAILVRPDGEVAIENNILTHAGEGPERAWGGIQIAAPGRGAELRGNTVTDALGHGITLGSARWRASDGSDLGTVGAGFGQRLPDDGPIWPTGHLEPQPAGESVPPLTYFPEPDEALADILIADNDIEACTGSGIGTLAVTVVHGDVARAAPLCMRRTTIVLERAEIRDNRLVGNARGAGATDPERTRGGIVLSEARALTLRGNRIVGPAPDDASGPRCGVFAGVGRDLLIARNRVSLRAREGTQDDPTRRPGASGGIVLGTNTRSPFAERSPVEATAIDVRIEDNVIATANAPALTARVGGACAVAGNALETAGTDGSAATTVTLFHLARVAEAVDLPAGEPADERWRQPEGSRTFLAGRAQDIVATGGLLCCDNQISTHLPRGPSRGGLTPVLTLSLGSVTFCDNQLVARLPPESLLGHALILGATVTAAGNRVAETIEAGHVSLIATAPFLTLAVDNHLTHCPVIHGCENDRSVGFFAARDNPTWLRLQSRRCATDAEALRPALDAFCRTLFGGGANDPDGTGDVDAPGRLTAMLRGDT